MILRIDIHLILDLCVTDHSRKANTQIKYKQFINRLYKIYHTSNCYLLYNI